MFPRCGTVYDERTYGVSERAEGLKEREFLVYRAVKSKVKLTDSTLFSERGFLAAAVTTRRKLCPPLMMMTTMKGESIRCGRQHLVLVAGWFYGQRQIDWRGNDLSPI